MHHPNLLSRPILYITQFLIIEGLAFLANLCFYHVEKESSICLVFKKFLKSFNYYGFVKNKLTFVVCFKTHVGSMVLDNLDKAFATT
jgi:hypothetical protein